MTGCSVSLSDNTRVMTNKQSFVVVVFMSSFSLLDMRPFCLDIFFIPRFCSYNRGKALCISTVYLPKYVCLLSGSYSRLKHWTNQAITFLGSLEDP